MLTLKSLTFSGIGRFVEEQTIDFTQLGSLVQVDGQNSNTGGSSGSGKSTIFKALEYLLGINDISNGILQSRLTKEAISVTGQFDFDTVPLILQRNKKLLIDLNGEVTTGSSKITEEKLDEIIGMPRDLFRKILHKRQGEGGFFLQMTPAEVHNFFIDCMSLQKEQSKVLKLLGILLDLEKADITLKSTVESFKSSIGATQRAIAALGSSPVKEIDPEAVEELKKKHLEAIEAHKLLKAVQQSAMDSLEADRPQIVSTPFDRSGIEQRQKQIDDIKVQMAQFEKVEQNRQSDVKTKISELKNLSSKLENSELTRQSEVKNQISAIRVKISKIQAAEQSRQAEVRSTISALRIELVKSQNTVSLGKKAKEAAITLAKELQVVKGSTCPTCQQGWVTEACKAKEASITAELLEHRKAVIAGNEADKRSTLINEQIQALDLESKPRPTLEVDELNGQIQTLNQDALPRVVPEVVETSYQIEHLKEEAKPKLIPEVVELSKSQFLINQMLEMDRKAEADHQFKKSAETQAILAIHAQKQTALRQSSEKALSLLRDAEGNAAIEHEMAQMKVNSFEESKKRFDDTSARLGVQLSGYEVTLKSRDLEQFQLQEEIDIVKESIKAIKSYLSCSFEDALDSIGDAATKFIRKVPNMQNGTIQFEGLKETKEGKVKEEVTCLISIDGEIGVPVKSLSGGEKSSTDLAIDLAVMEFIQEKAGKGINLLILDEPFNGLDESNISSIVELLRESGIDKQILIVDHNPIVKETFESKIVVVRDGLTSKVVQ